MHTVCYIIVHTLFSFALTPLEPHTLAEYWRERSTVGSWTRSLWATCHLAVRTSTLSHQMSSWWGGRTDHYHRSCTQRRSSSVVPLVPFTNTCWPILIPLYQGQPDHPADSPEVALQPGQFDSECSGNACQPTAATISVKLMSRSTKDHLAMASVMPNWPGRLHHARLWMVPEA